MSVVGIQGQTLEITVVSCSNLKDKEWISRQDPYVCVEYASAKFRTRTCTDGGKNPVFQEKFIITLIEGLREFQVAVWNSNSINADDFIGNGRVLLDKVLRDGYDDCIWPLQCRGGRHSGDIRLILHYPNAKRSVYPSYSSFPTHIPSPVPQPYGAPPAYPSQPSYAAYPPVSTNPPAGAYPPGGVYPPASWSYPPSAPSGYPPPPAAHSHYPPPQGLYPGIYPPPYH